MRYASVFFLVLDWNADYNVSVTLLQGVVLVNDNSNQGERFLSVISTKSKRGEME